MYCQNCGKQIPEGATFCSYCGAKQGTVTQTQTQKTASEPTNEQQDAFQGAQQNEAFNTQQAAAPNMQQAASSIMQQQKPKKKWISFLIPVLVFFLCALLGKYVLAPSLQSNKDSGQDNGKPTLPSLDGEEVVRPEGLEDETGDGEGSEVNPEYSELFFGTKVIHLPLLFGMDVESFAKKIDENGRNILCVDYGYRGDQVLTLVETIYITGIPADEETIQTLTEGAQSDAEPFEDVACANVTYSYNEDNEYYMLKFEFTDLDQPENCQILYDLGMITDAGAISLSESEKGMLADGYIKR